MEILLRCRPSWTSDDRSCSSWLGLVLDGQCVCGRGLLRHLVEGNFWEMKISAVIVTRGDVDLTRIIGSLPDEWEKIIWDNGAKSCYQVPDPPIVTSYGIIRNSRLSEQVPDLSVYGRYAAIEHAHGDLIYVQDDDCVVSDPEQIVWESDSGGSEYGRLVCNMPPQFRHDFYKDHALVGFGACFHRDLPEKAFNHPGLLWRTVASVDPGPNISDRADGFFNRTCDVVFTTLTPYTLVDVPVKNLPWASDENRMWKQKEHFGERKRMLELALKVRND